MGFKFSKNEMAEVFAGLASKYDIWAPVVKVGEGTFSDIDVVRYDKVTSVDDIEWNKKSDYSFKEVLLNINETLFYFTEGETSVPAGPEKDILVFLRSCDLHAVKRLDQIYLDNKFEDFYYKRIRDKVKFVLMGCTASCENGYCVSMGTNVSENYAMYMKVEDDTVLVDVKDADLAPIFESGSTIAVAPDFVTENTVKVTLPKNVDPMKMKDSPLWAEYGPRCIKCGRCNFACPTCTCFTMQDIFYTDNGKVGERRRIWASCQIDDYTTIAGGHQFRQSNADRMRFKTMHKIYDFEKRFGYPMCVGCGRCDDICPEYISHATLVNRLAKEEN